jgi:putative copper export protein
MARTVRRFLLAALPAVMMLLFAGASATQASTAGNNTLASSNPAASEDVSVAPTQLQLVFTFPLGDPNDVNQMGLSLVCNGNIVSLGMPQLGTDLKTVSVPLTQVPQAGSCVVSWALPDGSSGAYSFTSSIAAPTTTTSTIPGQTTVPVTVVPGGETTPVVDTSPRVGGPLGLFRMLSYLFVGTLFGAFLLILFAWPEGIEYAVCKRFIRIVWLGALASTLLVVIYTTAQYSGDGVTASISPNAWRTLFDALPGQALLLRLVVVAGVGWVSWDPQRALDPGTQLPGVVPLFIMCATFGFDRTGGRLPGLGYLSGILHMVSVSAWLGGLVLLSRVVLIGPGEPDLVQAVRGFGRIATKAIPIAIATGIFATYRFDGASLFTSQHGRLVLVKILVVAFMAYATFVTRTFVLTRMRNANSLNGRAASHLRRAVGTEATAGVVVLGLTAWMMATTPIHYMPSVKDDGPVYAFSEMLENDRFSVRFSVSPAVAGQNQVLIELFEPRRIQEFTVRMTPKAPGYDGYLVNVPLTRRGAAVLGQAGDFSLYAPGEWTIELNGTTTTGDLEPLATTLTLVDPATTTTIASGTTATSLVEATSTTGAG